MRTNQSNSEAQKITYREFNARTHVTSNVKPKHRYFKYAYEQM